MMRRPVASAPEFVLLAACAVACLAGPAVPRNGLSLTIRLGLKDKAPTRWNGRLSLSVGNMLAIEARTSKIASVRGNRWKAASFLEGQVAVVRGPFSCRLTASPDDEDWPAATPGKTSYYYVRGEQADGELVWASPMWITYKP